MAWNPWPALPSDLCLPLPLPAQGPEPLPSRPAPGQAARRADVSSNTDAPHPREPSGPTQTADKLTARPWTPAPSGIAASLTSRPAERGGHCGCGGLWRNAVGSRQTVTSWRCLEEKWSSGFAGVGVGERVGVECCQRPSHCAGWGRWWKGS